MDIAYFPGCSSHAMAREYDSTTRLVCQHLGIKLYEIDDWNCCGATAAHSLDHLLAMGLGARNLALVNKMHLNCVTSPCAGCYNRLKSVIYELNVNKALAARVEALIKTPFPRDLQVFNLLQIFVEADGLAKISSLVSKRLEGLKLAAYYGCLLTRPNKLTCFDDPEQPTSMDCLLQTLGAETVTWSHKAECCGGGYSVSETEIVVDLGGQVLEAARQAGAEAIVAACPMCQSNLDTRQRLINKDRGTKYNLPVIYLTQLMALAFGYSAGKLGFKKSFVSPLPLLASKGLL